MLARMILEKTISETDDRALDLAPVLLVDDDVASRLTLQTLLRAGGYCVDVASSAAEAIEKLDTSQYVLVLSDLGMKSSEGLEVLAYARRKEYRPATLLLYKTSALNILPSWVRTTFMTFDQIQHARKVALNVASLS